MNGKFDERHDHFPEVGCSDSTNPDACACSLQSNSASLDDCYTVLRKQNLDYTYRCCMRAARASVVGVVWLCIVLVFLYECPAVSAAAALVFTTSKSSSTAATATRASLPHVEIIRPGEAFRETKSGELSVVSFNILAPTYHWLGMEADDKNSQVESDRSSRVPMAIRMAKQVNADILCLQEVEGGSSEKLLKELLEEPQQGRLGYDSYLWSPLHPNRKGDVVGLCVAWRSIKHNLISPDCFRRGMVVQLEEIETGATFCIGNVHLPAKPAAIEGRLKAISTTIKSMASCESPRRVSALDGTAIIAGDFNCDQNSVAAKLLETGTAPYGTLTERNYKAKVTKEAAFGMKHSFRFKDAYANDLRQLAVSGNCRIDWPWSRMYGPYFLCIP